MRDVRHARGRISLTAVQFAMSKLASQVQTAKGAKLRMACVPAVSTLDTYRRRAKFARAATLAPRQVKVGHAVLLSRATLLGSYWPRTSSHCSEKQPARGVRSLRDWQDMIFNVSKLSAAQCVYIC